MKYLGIDYGRKKIGLSVSDGMLAEPYQVLKVKNETQTLENLTHLVEMLQVEHVIIGISEGEMALEIKDFAKKLQERITPEIIFQDETLSTVLANKLAIESGKKQKRRKEMEDAYAATVMLQNYLDL